MGKYKLTYFNSRGFAEIGRLILAANGEDFEDVRVERDAWPEIKPTTPQGKLPMLEINGKKICQSRAIWRRLARDFNMYGDNIDEESEIEIVLGTLDDLWRPLLEMNFGGSEESKMKAKKKMEDEEIPGFMNYLTAMLKSNANGYLVGKKLSLADIAFFAGTEQVAVSFPDFMEKYPDLSAHRKKIAELPKIKNWLDRRPVTQY